MKYRWCLKILTKHKSLVFQKVPADFLTGFFYVNVPAIMYADTVQYLLSARDALLQICIPLFVKHF